MIGLNQNTGQAITGLDHLYQSVARILTTPVGTRVARRSFGSDLAQLVDAPNNPATRVRLYAAVATALMRWERRLQLTRVSLVSDGQGGQVIDIEGIATESGEVFAASVPVGARGAA